MKTIFKKDDAFNEIIFEHKNKNYGAYALRKEQNEHILKGLLFTAGLIAVVVSWLMFPKNDGAKEITQIWDTTIVTIPPIDNPPVETNKPKKLHKPDEPKPNENSTKVASDEKIKDEEKPKEVENNGTDISNKPADTTGGVGDKGTLYIKKDEFDDTESKQVTEIPDKFPEFDNMKEYISKRLKYPVCARENEVEGRVVIAFVVEIDGTVSGLTPLTKLGCGCEEEAMRVINTMRTWRPGELNGKKRRVLVKLPIKFNLD